MADTSSIEGVLGEKKTDVDTLLQIARVTETAERFEDMCVVMGLLVKQKKEAKAALSVEERNMLSVAYKNVVGQRRASWRSLNDSAKEDKGEEMELAKEYKGIVEVELESKCNEVLKLLQDNLVDDTIVAGDKTSPDSLSNEESEKFETQVFYLKMCGDYYRYLAEFSDNDDYKKNAGGKYEAAMGLAEKTLEPTHPTRLGLALNASVCYWEILNQQKKACELAKKAFDSAIQKLDALSDSTYKDSTLIMQLLRDNLTIWTSEDKAGNQGVVEERED